MSSYYQTDLAAIHHNDFGAPAEGAAQDVIAFLTRQPGMLVDLGCGSGILAKRVSEAGFPVWGIDYSPEMIALAQEQAPKAKFVCGSLWETTLPAAMVVTAIGECVNYLFDERSSPEALHVFFQKVYDALLPGGLFLFDASMPGLLSKPRQQRFLETDDWAMLLDYSESPVTHILTRRITVFRKQGEHYRRSEEVHRLLLFEPDTVMNALQAAGFQNTMRLQHYGEYQMREKQVIYRAEKSA